MEEYCTISWRHLIVFTDPEGTGGMADYCTLCSTTGGLQRCPRVFTDPKCK